MVETTNQQVFLVGEVASKNSTLGTGVPPDVATVWGCLGYQKWGGYGLVAESMLTQKAGWWFGTFVIFPNSLDDDPI